jgi:hypothetical protein
LHGDIRRLRIAARCRDQSGPLKIVGERVVETNGRGAAGERQGDGKGGHRNSDSQSDALIF